LAQATLCYMGTQFPDGKGHRHSNAAPHFLAHVYCGEPVAHLSYCSAVVSLLSFNIPHVVTF